MADGEFIIVIRGGVVIAGRAEAWAGIIAVVGIVISVRIVAVGIGIGATMTVIPSRGLQSGFPGGFELRVGNLAEEFGFGVFGGCRGASGGIAVFGRFLRGFFGLFGGVFAFLAIFRLFPGFCGLLAIHERFRFSRAVFGFWTRLGGILMGLGRVLGRFL